MKKNLQTLKLSNYQTCETNDILLIALVPKDKKSLELTTVYQHRLKHTKEEAEKIINKFKTYNKKTHELRICLRECTFSIDDDQCIIQTDYLKNEVINLGIGDICINVNQSSNKGSSENIVEASFIID